MGPETIMRSIIRDCDLVFIIESANIFVRPIHDLSWYMYRVIQNQNYNCKLESKPNSILIKNRKKEIDR